MVSIFTIVYSSNEKERERRRESSETFFNYLIITRYVNNVHRELVFFCLASRHERKLDETQKEVTLSVFIFCRFILLLFINWHKGNYTSFQMNM